MYVSITEMKDTELRNLITTLKGGGIAIVRTDTLYGIVARADDEAAVARVYAVKNRAPHKSCIILVGSAEQAYGNVEELEKDIKAMSDTPTSFLLEASSAPHWLLRQNTYLAHRLPAIDWLRRVARETGPLIAPSANPEGEPPARTIDEAKAYFGDQVDFYLDGGEVPVDTPPSRLVRIEPDGAMTRLR